MKIFVLVNHILSKLCLRTAPKEHSDQLAYSPKTDEESEKLCSLFLINRLNRTESSICDFHLFFYFQNSILSQFLWSHQLSICAFVEAVKRHLVLRCPLRLLSSQIICENKIPLQAVRGVKMLHWFHYSSWKDFLCILFALFFQRSPIVELFVPVSILHKSIAGCYRPVRVADGPITACCRFINNASWGDCSSCR